MKDLKPMQLIAFSLRRSGSTAFWKIFEKHPDYLALDEPCSPLLSRLPDMNKKETWADLIAIYKMNPDFFRQKYFPVTKKLELTTECPDQLIDYFKFLVQDKENWFIDMTRCHLKVAGLSKAFPEVKAIHLFRKPKGFVTSHMLPSYGRLNFFKQTSIYKHYFWRRQSGFNNWSIELLYNRWFYNLAYLFPQLDIPDHALKVEKSHEKLLLYWLFHYRYMEKYGRDSFGDRYSKVCFDELCNGTMESDKSYILNIKILNDINNMDYSHLRPVNPGYSTENIRWANAMKKVGFTSEEISEWG